MQPTPLHSAVSSIPCFASLPPDQQIGLSLLCSVTRYDAGEYVFVYGDHGDALYLVSEGRVEVFTHNNAGEEIALEVIEPGGVFGEVALFNGETRTANVKAMNEGAVLVRIGSGDVSAALSLCPSLRDMLLHGMARRLRASSNSLRHLTTFDINAVKRRSLTRFDQLCEKTVDVIAGVPFLALLVVGGTLWTIFKPFHDTSLNFFSLALSEVSLLVAMLVLLNQNRQEKLAKVVDAEESLAIRQGAREQQYLHEKLDAVLSRVHVAPRESHPRDGASGG